MSIRTAPSPRKPRLLALELWGLGDVALALRFLRVASQHAHVTLVAKPHAAPLLRRFAPAVELISLEAPWTAFSGKYRLHRWPWHKLHQAMAAIRAGDNDIAVSARPDPRDHSLMLLAGAEHRYGFPRRGSRVFLTHSLPPPPSQHRAAHWAAIAGALGWPAPPSAERRTRPIRKVVLHRGAGHPVRIWPAERFAQIARRLAVRGIEVTTIDDDQGDLDSLISTLERADAFIGNDSGPGHLAALLGLPTFTVFGPQLPELFAPVHPQAGWIEGMPCPHKPCFDSCRFTSPRCLLDLDTDRVGERVEAWLNGL
ncbi:MAG TPA: glycosyltransferase family 9 protein [Opitutaceae bacterium]